MEFFTIFLNLFSFDLKFIIAFLIFFLLDFICGFSKGVFIEGISSHKLRMSVPKFIGYVGFFLMCLTLDTLIILTFEKDASFIAVGATIGASAIEAKSVTENLKELGIDIPKIVYNGINLLTSKKEEETEDDTE